MDAQYILHLLSKDDFPHPRIINSEKDSDLEFKGTWLWVSPIGFAVAALISSSFLRWVVVSVSVLGCLFALIFRMTRPEGEI